MQEYEIRVLRPNLSTELVVEMVHLSDIAAVPSSKRIAKDRPFEVWRGLYCVYGREDFSPSPDWDGPRTAA
jgi:hypothetical protein